MRAFLSLGSNKGDRLSYIQQAVNMLSISENISITKSSSFYETEPWGVKNQNWFINAVIEIETKFEPLDLLKYTQNIEQKLGRNRLKEKRWHERTIDIDILFFEDKIYSIENILTIPHPLIQKRAFVLIPMMEIASDFVHPVYKKTITQLYDELNDPEDIFLYGTIKS